MKTMKTNQDQLADGRMMNKQHGQSEPGIQRISAVDPPERRNTWFNSYDEEWEAFVEEHAIHKNRPGINGDEPEPLPRVWNCPHG
ncbi:MAG: hypothetical protein V4689_22350 [Verrucomicrobiota bacterium]